MTRRLIQILLGCAVALGLLTALVRYGPSSDPGLNLIANLATGTRVGDLGWLKVSGIRGDPWSDFTVTRVELADRSGVWLSAREVRLNWRPSELLSRRLHFKLISARTLSLLRHPGAMPVEARAGGPAALSIKVDRLAAKVEMTPAFALKRGAYLVEAAGSARRNGALSGRLSGVSLEHPGDFVRFGFTLDDSRIDLEGHAREAMGGALAGSLGLDADKAFLLDVTAHGSPNKGAFAVRTQVGSATPAQASGAWSPRGGEASGQLDLAASRWLAPWKDGIGPVASFRIDAVALPKGLYRIVLDAHGANLALTASGEVDPQHVRTGSSGVTVGVKAGELTPLLSIPGLGPARLSGRLTGGADSWTLAGVGVMEKVNEVGVRLVSLSGPFSLAGARGGLILKGQALGVGDPGSSTLGALLGSAPKVAGEIDWLPDGRTLWRKLAIQGAAMDVAGQGAQGLFGAISFTGTVRVRNLAGVAPGARGAVDGDWKAAQSRSTSPWTFSLRAKAAGLRLTSAEADSLLGATPEFRADGRLAEAGVSLDRAELKGSSGTLGAAGAIGAKGDLRIALDWTTHGPILLGPLSITGASQGSGKVTGGLDRPRLDLIADFKVIELPDLSGLDLRGARVALTLLDDGAGLGGRFGLTAVSDSGPAKAAATFRFGPAATSLSDIDLDAGGVTIKGSGTLDHRDLTQADLTVGLGPGAFIRRGRADGRIQVSPSPDGAHVHLAFKAAGVALDGADVDALTLTADGPVRRLPYQIDARGDAGGVRARLAGSGVVTDVRGDRGAEFAGSGRIGQADFQTLSPARLTFAKPGLAVKARLGLAKGQADITIAQAGPKMNGHAIVTGVSLAVLDPDIQGKVDGDLTFLAENGGLSGALGARVSGVVARDAGVQGSMAGTLNATFGAGRVDLQTRLTDAHGSRLAADLRLPAHLSSAPFDVSLDRSRPMSGAFSADGQIGPVWDLIEGGGRSLSGHLVASGAIGGSVDDPRLTGTASVTDGDFEDAAIGLRLKALTLRATLRGDVVDVSQFSATDAGKGVVSGSGRLSLIRGGASGLRVSLKGFRLIDNALGQASASGNIDVDRAADGKVRLAGALTIDRAQISPKAALPSGVVPMEVVEIHRPGEEPALAAPPPDREAPVALDIALTAPSGIYIKGRGLNLEMSMDARVSGSTDAPVLTGVARVVRGDYDFAGKRFQVDDRGVVYLASTADAVRLDLTATRDDPTLTAVIRIGGTAAAPTLVLSSTPALPKDEVLSQVLFGASAAQLSGFQAAQLASAVAGLAGGGGFDVIGGLRGFAHLDRLAIDSSAAAGFAVAGGKYISDNVYVEVQGGRTGQGAQVEWRVRKHLAIVSRVTSQGDQAVSVRWRRDY